MQKRWSINSSCYHFPLFKKLLIFFIFLDFTYLFLGGKGGRETSMWERYIHWLPLACPQLGTWPAPHACALTGNWTSDLLVHRPALNPLIHTSQGWLIFFFLIERGRGRSSDLLFPLFLSSLFASCKCLDQGSRPHPWYIGMML